ncbi:MAG: hypothetical protein JSW71_05120, partial [Gemmatimonadota bacterium]
GCHQGGLMGFRNSEEARAAGRESGRARKAKAREKLNLANVEAAFGPLETIEDAQRRLERLGVWAAAGMLAGTVAGAAVRSVEVWLKAHESRLTQDVVESLKKEVDRLKLEAKGRPARALR